ncbi:hypothetical protein [Vibrio vulnificus YJ016]|uniref:Uncharacterized protein n=1 Tax=Vibrio vulnificus (strain YJ016) TaxID=196600 RepID=Q7MHY5_VIBVY|nr:hypothetical protein [Vibrio vulnificus YJ016]
MRHSPRIDDNLLVKVKKLVNFVKFESFYSYLRKTGFERE